MQPPIRGYWQDTKHEIACRNLYQIFSTEALTSRSFALGAVITVELERARKPTFETLCWVLCRTPPPIDQKRWGPQKRTARVLCASRNRCDLAPAVQLGRQDAMPQKALHLACLATIGTFVERQGGMTPWFPANMS